MEQSEPSARRRAAVRAASRSLAELLDQRPPLEELLDAAELPGRAELREAARHALEADGVAGVRAFKRARLLQVAAFDLAGDAGLDEVGRALADLADACLEAVLLEVDPRRELAIVGMGKLGGRELNYVSDIDVVFVTAGDVTAVTRAAERLLRELGEFTPQGRAFEIDTNLRPEGRSGALVRSADAYLEYYRRWAKDWEYQALIKARGVAGALDVATRVIEGTRMLVYPPSVDADRVAAIRRMKERVEDHAQRSSRRGRSSEVDDVKLGPGGIRDIEFSVQLLQLVHGGADESVRHASTLTALSALVEGGYVADEDGAGLAVAYRWLRSVEHRLQLFQERRVHQLPSNDEARAVLARAMGFRDGPQASAEDRFMSVHRSVLADVRARFDKLFYRPMIEALADRDAGGLSLDALKQRLRILGFRDVDRAARTLDGLVSGTGRRAKLFRVLSPPLLRFLSQTPLPDEGLFSFLRLGEALHERLDALGAMRDNPPAVRFLAQVLGSGRFLGDVLPQVPEELQTIADPDGAPALKEPERVAREARASLQWREPERRLDGLRRFKRRESVRIALADLSGTADVSSVGASLSHLADACLQAALGDEPGFAVIGMGKLGGRELSYSSDIDVMFVHDRDPSEAERVAEELLRAIGEVTPEGQAFRIDPDLRPEGRSGPLTRTLASFVEYYERWAQPWEYQALIKARAAAGDRELGDAFVHAVARFPFGARVEPEALGEIRHLKARMERERIARGTEPRRHLKLGPGGMSDVEFAVQIMQLRYGHELDELRRSNTLEALQAAERAGVVSTSDAERLREAYEFLLRLRNRLFFMTGRPSDQLPARPEDVEALGVAMEFREQPRQELEETYLRLTRRARRVAEPLIYG